MILKIFCFLYIDIKYSYIKFVESFIHIYLTILNFI